ncbi:hypothetical protein ACFVQB_11425 [Paenibacillus sp. NPDC057886]|uniref:hypothetical protein n=1 Tax=Paenibacillus sp. NPDC057886 TaxID=3346270 RepID=UPI0036A9E965
MVELAERFVRHVGGAAGDRLHGGGHFSHGSGAFHQCLILGAQSGRDVPDVIQVFAQILLHGTGIALFVNGVQNLVDIKVFGPFGRRDFSLVV